MVLYILTFTFLDSRQEDNHNHSESVQTQTQFPDKLFPKSKALQYLLPLLCCSHLFFQKYCLSKLHNHVLHLLLLILMLLTSPYWDMEQNSLFFNYSLTSNIKHLRLITSVAEINALNSYIHITHNLVIIKQYAHQRLYTNSK
jgi:hypothetical protein